MFLCGLLAALAAPIGGCRRAEAPPSAAAPPPNVVLISIDCINQRQIEHALAEGWIPAVAELAADGILFSRGYAHAPWTMPSHMNMLTGLYPSQHGRNVPWMLMQQVNATFARRPAFESLADRLAARGYETAAFVGKGSISAPFGHAQGFEQYNEHRGVHAGGTRTEDDLPQIDAALQQWLARRRPKPFFLFVHSYDVHEPRSAALAEDRDALAHVDRYVGRLLFRLRQLGLYESSLIVLTSDHGSRMIHTDGKCCGHGVGHYEENLRVPFILKLPGEAWGARSEMLVRHVDLLPTVLDLIDEPDGSYNGPGVSILSRLALAEEAADPVTASFSEADGRCAARRALVTRRWKYIYTPADLNQFLLTRSHLFFNNQCPAACRDVPPEELYDLEADPFETENLLLAPLAPEAAVALRELRQQMEEHLNLPRQYANSVYTIEEAVAVQEAPAEIDESVREAMRALGYGN